MSRPSEFYRDFQIPEVEYLARAASIAFCLDPDALVPETGYADAGLIPTWWRYQSDALKFIAMRDASALNPTSRPME